MVSRRIVLVGLAAALAGCAENKFPTYRGPEVTQIIVMKSDRKMYLLHHDKVLRSYNIELGFAPNGHKLHEGDGRTPEGVYWIDRRNPNSSFYLSLGISYPNSVDVEVARGIGKSPGGDIFIHGERRPWDPKGPDWTAGCIAVTNKEMREIYSMVRTGTRIDINP
jgi:murein L,D-transpeptidase YafK